MMSKSVLMRFRGCLFVINLTKNALNFETDLKIRGIILECFRICVQSEFDNYIVLCLLRFGG